MKDWVYEVQLIEYTNEIYLLFDQQIILIKQINQFS